MTTQFKNKAELFAKIKEIEGTLIIGGPRLLQEFGDSLDRESEEPLTILERDMKTCYHNLQRLTDLGFAEEGHYCTKCGMTLKGDKIIPATSFVKTQSPPREEPQKIEKITRNWEMSYGLEKVVNKLDEVIDHLTLLEDRE